MEPCALWYPARILPLIYIPALGTPFMEDLSSCCEVPCTAVYSVSVFWNPSHPPTPSSLEVARPAVTDSRVRGFPLSASLCPTLCRILQLSRHGVMFCYTMFRLIKMVTHTVPSLGLLTLWDGKSDMNPVETELWTLGFCIFPQDDSDMCSNFLSRMCHSSEPQFPGRHGISRVRRWYSSRHSLTKLRGFARLGRLNVFLDLRYFQFKMRLIWLYPDSQSKRASLSTVPCRLQRLKTR